MIIATIPAFVLIAGLLVYGLTTHKTIGLVMFGCGLLALLIAFSGHAVRL